ncbi:ift122 [Symbiodinium natans]|uniref:Ift122 protein n=1 Tax=Symbiodinium natans TaxID=878477 RepID=A0A812RFH5_9DINO|nr:ift122 [Symbiodinium natans]
MRDSQSLEFKELENTVPLSLYLKCIGRLFCNRGPDCKQIAVSLLVNIEPAISALEGAPRIEIQPLGCMMRCSPNPKGPQGPKK